MKENKTSVILDDYVFIDPKWVTQTIYEILDKTRELVIQEFEKTEEDVKDGMDISLCALNLKTNTLTETMTIKLQIISSLQFYFSL